MEGSELMDANIKELQIRDYADELLSPEQSVSVTCVEHVQEEEEELTVWLLETDAGSEYWVIEGEWLDLVRKSGLINSPQRAVATYLEQLAQPVVEVQDRFQS